MLAFDKCWKVSNDIIYLPSLPRPPYDHQNDVTKLKLNFKVNRNSLFRLENILPNVTNLYEILDKMFPFSSQIKKDILKQELLNRLNASYFENSVDGCHEYLFAPGKCMFINNEVYATLPRCVEF